MSTGNDEARDAVGQAAPGIYRPFSRNQRGWIYTSSKLNARDYVIVKHAAFPHPPPAGGDAPHHPLPCAKVLGVARGRRLAFRPPSVVNVSGMGFGALSGAAVQALNAGCR